MTLDADITRCHGEGHWGRICPKRATCARYRSLQTDPARLPHHRISHADMLCHDPRYLYLLPESTHA